MGSFRERQRRAREDLILSAAQNLIARKGYYAMAMDDLAEQVGIAKATLYQHFATKEDLVAAVIMRDMDRFLDRLAGLQAEGRAPLERLAESLAWIIERRHVEDCPDYTGTPEELFRLFHARPDFIAYQERCWFALSAVVADAKAAGQIRPDIPDAVIVALYFTIAIGHLFTIIVREEMISRQELRTALIRILLEGIAVVPTPVPVNAAPPS